LDDVVHEIFLGGRRLQSGPDHGTAPLEGDDISSSGVDDDGGAEDVSEGKMAALVNVHARIISSLN